MPRPHQLMEINGLKYIDGIVPSSDKNCGMINGVYIYHMGRSMVHIYLLEFGEIKEINHQVCHEKSTSPLLIWINNLESIDMGNLS
jgi:hypothetical protein